MQLFETTYPVRTFQVTPRKTLGLVAHLNLLQDVAWRHGEAAGYGWDQWASQGAFWVMTRQTLELDGEARLGETVTVKSWLRAPEGAFVTRDFVTEVDGRPLGRAATTFTLVDAATRRPRRDWSAFDADHLVRREGTLDLVPRKIPRSADAREIGRVRARASDLDVNDHVNNTRYAAWILDATGTAARPLRYEICFLAEARLGDEIAIEADSGVFQGVRLGDGAAIFTAALEFDAAPC